MLKPTKANRAAAPDLFGAPAYYDNANHQVALIEQLRSLDLMPAVWALEDLIWKTAETEDLADRVDDLAISEKALEGAQEKLEELQSFFEDIVYAFEHAPGCGRWPAAEPHDQSLRRAIIDALARSTPEPEEA